MTDQSDEPVMLQNYVEVSYNMEDGDLVTIDSMLGKQTTEIVRVRAELQDKVLRQACIYELEKLGYCITGGPEDRP